MAMEQRTSSGTNAATGDYGLWLMDGTDIITGATYNATGWVTLQ